ncbi:hybrid sensor histidine kinase/response regulator [Flavobacterium orientale]|uniref:histidine kinase n=1 Tax=Flavobacterium orientale TaxID=1756020 RepID=A0A916Y2P5_9FLAO|nr:hybrid sensor histidine kinase/response regulator [Flavobacterium orientale]GGD27220.1 hybrid sensor histidine kinase/response regulator [Flavobacterium orientale]
MLVSSTVSGQFIIKPDTTLDEVSLHPYATLARLGAESISLDAVLQLDANQFETLPNSNTDLGFTSDHYWLRFSIRNELTTTKIFFLEACRPIVDVAELYTIDANGAVTKQVSGDALPFSERDFKNRKTIFKVAIAPQTTKQYYLHLKSDGEAINAGLVLRSYENLMETSMFEQLVFGIFYGILGIAAIIYLFFFFALGQRSFLYYSLYVVFIGLLQFSLDGLFFQFITPGSGWLSLNAVILSACIANFFLGRYAQVFLKVKEYSSFLNSAFYVVYVLDFLLLISLFVHPGALAYSYPLANLFGLLLLLLIISSVVVIYVKTRKVDYFFVIGIFFLIAGFVVFILKNFSMLPVTFWTENGSKLGTGLEVVFLSLSMANLIRKLRDEREEMQDIALQKSEEMNEMKTYFLSNISHELRTPLNAILNLSKILIKETTEPTVQKNAMMIKDSSYNLLSSVNDILDFSKIEKGELQLDKEPFLLRPLLEHMIANMHNKAKSQDLKFEALLATDLPAQLVGDKFRLTQIIYNLMSNAFKFTAEGFVTLTVSCKPLKGNQIALELSVEDSGVGIDAKKLSAVYDSFSQENITDKRKYGGLGLGLFIVKHLADLHQGSIAIQSKVNEGTVSKVTLHFDVLPLAEPTEVLPEAETYDLHGKRILVAEDNAMNQMVLKMITKKWQNTEIVFTNNGQECVDALQENNFDIILMDLQMPVMDGYEATLAIRAGASGDSKKDIPIVAVTADVMESTKIRVMEIGMNKYISKPLDKEALYKMVKELTL